MMEGCLASIGGLIALALFFTPLILSILAYRRNAGLTAKLGNLEEAARLLAQRLSQVEASLSSREGAAPPRAAFERSVDLPAAAGEPLTSASPAIENVLPQAAVEPTTVPWATEVPAESIPPTLLTQTNSEEQATSAPAEPTPPPFETQQPLQPVPPSPPKPSLEERLGIKPVIWLGSISLALTGLFLVKYTLDQGLLSPTVRIASAIGFGMALLAGGEYLGRRSKLIAAGLSAAGIAVLFAAFLGGVHLYQLIPPPVGFGLMALTTAVAVALSLRRGPIVAIVGLIGGFTTPLWIQTGEPDAKKLFAYLLLLQVGLLAVARKRGWWGISAASLGAGALWVAAWLAGPWQARDGVWIGLFLLSSVAVGLVSLLRSKAADDAATAEGEGIAATTPAKILGSVILGLSALLGAALVARSNFGTTEWGFFGLLAAATLVLGRLRREFEPLPWIAALAGGALLGGWDASFASGDTTRFLLTTAAYGALFAIGGFVSAFGARKPGAWASLAAVVALAAFGIAWLEARDSYTGWGTVALGLGVAFVAAALPFAKRRPEYDGALAAFAVAATTFASLAAPLELERQWITVAWAIEVAALVWIAAKIRLPALPILTRLVAVMVLARLLLNPLVLTYSIGATPIWNWLLYGYGLPLLAFAFAAWYARKTALDAQPDSPFALATQLEAGAIGLTVALVTLQIHQFFHGDGFAHGAMNLAEAGALSIAWIALGLLFRAAQERWPRPSFAVAGTGLVDVGLVATILLPGLGFNPLWSAEAVGENWIANDLLWVYGVPLVLFALAGRSAARRGQRIHAWVWNIASFVLAFALLNLEIRQAFHGTRLDGGLTSVAERYTYSTAWALFGVGLLIAGIVRKGRPLRVAGLGVILLTAAKVFLVDMSSLSGLYRIFSFFGLGVSLMLIAYLYQRFVFRKESS